MAAEDAAPRPRSLSPGVASVPALATAVAAVASAAPASGSPFAALDRVRSASSSASSGSAGGHKKPRKPKKKKKSRRLKSELTPLLLARPEEEVHPLPWFRSPEWTRRSPVRLDAQRSRRRGPDGADRPPSSSSTSWWHRCCFPCGGGDAPNGAETESDMELGVLPPPKEAAAGAGDADGFKQCIQFLVGLIVLVAIALILLIIFQPRALPPPPHGP